MTTIELSHSQRLGLLNIWIFGCNVQGRTLSALKKRGLADGLINCSTLTDRGLEVAKLLRAAHGTLTGHDGKVWVDLDNRYVYAQKPTEGIMPVYVDT